MMQLGGVISDRIRRGEIDANNDFRSASPPPSAEAVRHGSGQSVGNGSGRTSQR